jgi:hypothetical protein
MSMFKYKETSKSNLPVDPVRPRRKATVKTTICLVVAIPQNQTDRLLLICSFG